jgi:hypothetical protein
VSEAFCLRPGATGFAPRNGLRLDLRALKSAVYAVALHTRRDVLSFEPQCHSRSFHAATLAGRDGVTSILCNITYPWAAFVMTGTYTQGRMIFIDDDELSGAFRDITEIEPLTRQWLEEDLAVDRLAELAPQERAQIRYWHKSGPLRVGDVIYNLWD